MSGLTREDSFYPLLDNVDSVDVIDPLLRLKEALEGAQKNTHKMINKLNKFEKTLDDLDKKMQPIQENTQHYTKAKENISLTLTEVNKTYEYFRVANTVKEVINKGITTNNHDEYFDSLVKLSYAKAFFESHREIKSSGTVLTSIDDLLQKAVASCTAELEKLLAVVGSCVTVEGDQFQIINPMPADVSKQIKSICDTFESAKSTVHLKIYQSARIIVVKNSLKAAEASLPTAVNMLSDDPYTKGSHPFHTYVQHSLHLLRGEFQLWGNNLPSTVDSLNMYIAICDSAVADLQRFLSPYLSEEKSSKTNPVTRMCKLLLMRLDISSTFLNVFDDLHDICHPDSRHESTASIAVKALRDEVLVSCARVVEYLLSSSLSEGLVFGSQSKKQVDISVCDLHPVTGNCIYSCKELQNSYSSPYRKMADQSRDNVPSDVEEFIAMLLENVFVALESHSEKLDDAKVKSLRRSLSVQTHSLFEASDHVAEDLVLGSRKHLFLCNNHYSMCNYFRDRREASGERREQSAEGPLGRRTSFRFNTSKQSKAFLLAEKVDGRFHAEQELFCESIAIALGLGVQDMADFDAMYAKDKANQHRVLKAKFMVFNTGLDALLAQQGEWRVSSAGLRESLSRQLVQRVAPVYAQFHATYSTVRFSKKHMGEYIKFSPQQVEGHLRSFFGRTT